MSNPTDEHKFSATDLYKEFWKCRDFELDHLWQRSVFLAVFMIAVATGYGVFVNAHITFILPSIIKNNYSEIAETFKNEQLRYVWLNPQTSMPSSVFHSICLGFCFLGIMFSQLWIMMAKGSKRWYERYEDAISSFYHDTMNGNDKFDLFDSDLKKIIQSGEIRFFGSLYDREINNSLMSSKGGEYSVSRVNIFIGQLVCFVWIVLGGIHLFFELQETETSWCKYAVPFICVAAFACLSKVVISHFTHSED